MSSSQWAPEGSAMAKFVEETKMTRPNKNQIFSCPRCHSTNTKFCYYNNYSLNQPRYLCKTCKRYWTQGGSLRNIPIGGGSRKTKKTNSPQVQGQNYVVSQFQEMPKIENNLHGAQTSALGMNMMMHGNTYPTIPCAQTGEFCFQDLKPTFGVGDQGETLRLSFGHLYKQISRASEGDQNEGQCNSSVYWNQM